MPVDIETVTSVVLELGEGPHWDHVSQCLYFVGINDKTINRYDPKTKKHTLAKLPENVSYIIPVQGKKDQFVVSQGTKVVLVHWAGEGDATVLKEVVTVDQDVPFNTFNDGKADPKGRLFCGTLNLQTILWNPEKLKNEVVPKEGSVYRIDQEGTTTKVEKEILLANGLAWDLKEKAFYYIDTLVFAIWRYDYDEDTGNISNRSVVFELKGTEHEGGYLDGMTIDTDGNLWVALICKGKVLNVDPRTGKVLRFVELPTSTVTSCTFGGSNLDELYVTSGDIAAFNEPKPGPPAGLVFKVTGLGVKGFPNTPFQYEG